MDDEKKEKSEQMEEVRSSDRGFVDDAPTEPNEDLGDMERETLEQQ